MVLSGVCIALASGCDKENAQVAQSAQGTEISQSVCGEDMNYISESGHEHAMQLQGVMLAIFKTSKTNDFDGFMDVAADPYIQHSPDLADGWKPVWDLMVNRPAGFSTKKIDWLGNNGLLDNGNFLVMFREVDRGDGTGPSKIVDLMRFDAQGKYAEHWDIRQPLSKQTVSGNSETGTADKFANMPVSYSVEQEEHNKKIAVKFLNLAFNQGQLDKALDEHVDQGYIQHNPMIADGIEPVKQIFAQGKIPALCYDIKYVVAQNDIVVVYSKVTSSAGISAVVDILRVRDGKLVEHWDVVEAVPADSEMPHKNGMF